MDWLNRVFGKQNHAAISYIVALVLIGVYATQPELRDGGLLGIIAALLGYPRAMAIDLRRWRNGSDDPSVPGALQGPDGDSVMDRGRSVADDEVGP